MGNFGEDLRMERLSRGIALEDITAVTKISQRYLVALEQESFRLLPGGILSKGIVRSYVGALGLDPQDWTERYLQAYNASGQMLDDDRSWTAFAPTLAKPASCATKLWRSGCAGSGLSCCCSWSSTAAFLIVRFYGIRVGWWHGTRSVHAEFNSRSSAHPLVSRPSLLAARSTRILSRIPVTPLTPPANLFKLIRQLTPFER